MRTYQKRPHSGDNAPQSPVQTAAETGNFNYQPTQADMGSRVDLPEVMRAKMESAFGMDFSGVQLYQSQAVADAGANAITMGNKIAFAPGKLDFTSHSGQALLGHELSHVASQARGEVSGQGFLNDGLLEARADREGAMAAAGQQVYTGPVTPLSGSTAMSAAGPMQAKKAYDKELRRYRLNDDGMKAVKAHRKNHLAALKNAIGQAKGKEEKKEAKSRYKMTKNQDADSDYRDWIVTTEPHEYYKYHQTDNDVDDDIDD